MELLEVLRPEDGAVLGPADDEHATLEHQDVTDVGRLAVVTTVQRVVAVTVEVPDLATTLCAWFSRT